MPCAITFPSPKLDRLSFTQEFLSQRGIQECDSDLVPDTRLQIILPDSTNLQSNPCSPTRTGQPYFSASIGFDLPPSAFVKNTTSIVACCFIVISPAAPWCPRFPASVLSSFRSVGHMPGFRDPRSSDSAAACSNVNFDCRVRGITEAGHGLSRVGRGALR